MRNGIKFIKEGGRLDCMGSKKYYDYSLSLER